MRPVGSIQGRQGEACFADDRVGATRWPLINRPVRLNVVFCFLVGIEQVKGGKKIALAAFVLANEGRDRAYIDPARVDDIAEFEDLEAF